MLEKVRAATQRTNNLVKQLKHSDSLPVLDDILEACQSILKPQRQVKIRSIVISEFTNTQQRLINIVRSDNSLSSGYIFYPVNPDYFLEESRHKSIDIDRARLISQQGVKLDDSKVSFVLEERLLIGRDIEKLRSKSQSRSANILSLSHYSRVSSVHTEILVKPYSIPKVWQVTDLGSTNGTYVNGEKLTPHSAQPTFRRLTGNKRCGVF